MMLCLWAASCALARRRLLTLAGNHHGILTATARGRAPVSPGIPGHPGSVRTGTRPVLDHRAGGALIDRHPVLTVQPSCTSAEGWVQMGRGAAGSNGVDLEAARGLRAMGRRPRHHWSTGQRGQQKLLSCSAVLRHSHQLHGSPARRGSPVQLGHRRASAPGVSSRAGARGLTGTRPRRAGPAPSRPPGDNAAEAVAAIRCPGTLTARGGASTTGGRLLARVRETIWPLGLRVAKARAQIRLPGHRTPKAREEIRLPGHRTARGWAAIRLAGRRVAKEWEAIRLHGQVRAAVAKPGGQGCGGARTAAIVMSRLLGRGLMRTVDSGVACAQTP
mmetsp:Transcript_71269/g.202048  ORF Transcript_71269/g.202048 Transcript_71269/m.202048 type:complete len:332 (+) Transcript_71269:2948-3943(+)